MTTETQQPAAGLHTEDMQEIITKVPSWILRWGITLFFGILLMIVGISALIRYPDTIKGGLKLESAGIARPVIAANTCRIEKVLVKQGEMVKAGQALAWVMGLGGVAPVDALVAPQAGRVGFISLAEPGYVLKAGQEVFVIHDTTERFYGLMEIPQAGIGKIRTGQQVLVSLRNYPPETYGKLKGKVSYIADEPDAAGFFTVKVELPHISGVALKWWMAADAEIITENVSLESRIYKSIVKGLQ